MVAKVMSEYDVFVVLFHQCKSSKLYELQSIKSNSKIIHIKPINMNGENDLPSNEKISGDINTQTINIWVPKRYIFDFL